MLRALQSQGVEAWGYDPYPVGASDPHILSGDRATITKSVGQVDDIVVNHVLEHIVDPLDTLIFLRGLLRCGGRIHIRVPNLESPLRVLARRRWIHWHAPFHLQHFTVRTLDHLARRAGLARVAYRSYTPTHWVVANFRSVLRASVAGPNRGLHREVSTEVHVAARMLALALRPWGGDALDVVYCMRNRDAIG
jgi:predicted SAM-dependent methyltransferase